TAPLLAEEFKRCGLNPAIALEAARIHIACGRNHEAVQVLEQLARVDPSNGRLHLLLARSMRRRGDLVRAVRHIEVASRISPDIPELAVEAALVGLSRGFTDDARGILSKHLEKVAEKVAEKTAEKRADKPTEPEIRGLLFDRVADRIDTVEFLGALLAVGLAHDAEKYLLARFGTDVLRSHSNDAEILRLAARIALERGNLGRGRALSRRLLRLEPDSIAALHNLALIALTRRRFAASWEWIKRARTIAPTDPGIRKLRTLWWWVRLTPRLK
ncbi:MAG: tetratricopeptide repeat protein, partial [Planctomycetota bacterium]